MAYDVEPGFTGESDIVGLKLNISSSFVVQKSIMIVSKFNDNCPKHPIVMQCVNFVRTNLRAKF